MPSKYPAHPVAIGQTFHYLTVVAKYRFGLWVCRCRCGRETKVAGAKLVSGHSKSSRCGCWRKDHPPEPAIKDKLGQRYGRLTVVKYVGIKKHQAFWLCQCDCGNTAERICGALREGGTTSCGCMVLDLGKYPGHRAWQAKNRHAYGLAASRGLYRTYRKAAEKRGLPFTLSFDVFADLTRQDCHYCGTPPKQCFKSLRSHGAFVYNGLDRIDNTGGYTTDNVVPACFVCNSAKGTRSMDDFASWIVTVYGRLAVSGKRSA
jgi:hypothetical protein